MLCAIKAGSLHFIQVSEGLGLIIPSPKIFSAPSVSPFLIAFIFSKSGEGRKEGERGFIPAVIQQTWSEVYAEPAPGQSSGATEYNQI